MLKAVSVGKEGGILQTEQKRQNKEVCINKSFPC